MTAAAFQGVFSDFRMVRGRKVAQFVVEVPLEQAGAALEVMGGLPMPEESRWVAVARMNLPTENKATAVGQVAGGGATEIPRAKPEKTPQQKAAIRAVLLCKESAFQKWLARTGEPCPDEAAAAAITRDIIGAVSRRDIAADPNVYDRWVKLAGEYDDFQRYGDHR